MLSSGTKTSIKSPKIHPTLFFNQNIVSYVLLIGKEGCNIKLIVEEYNNIAITTKITSTYSKYVILIIQLLFSKELKLQ